MMSTMRSVPASMRARKLRRGGSGPRRAERTPTAIVRADRSVHAGAARRQVYEKGRRQKRHVTGHHDNLLRRRRHERRIESRLTLPPLQCDPPPPAHQLPDMQASWPTIRMCGVSARTSRAGDRGRTFADRKRALVEAAEPPGPAAARIAAVHMSGSSSSRAVVHPVRDSAFVSRQSPCLVSAVSFGALRAPRGRVAAALRPRQTSTVWVRPQGGPVRPDEPVLIRQSAAATARAVQHRRRNSRWKPHTD